MLELWPVWLILGVWLIGLTWLWWQSQSHYRKLTAGISKKDLKEILERLMANSEAVEKAVGELNNRQGEAETAAKSYFQKLGFVRFNPFTDTGGDQSFCLAILDRHDNGIVISSLHSRDQTRIYAKRITRGRIEGAEFSKEEKRAFENAQQL